jgi:hypothetical protein
MKDYPGNIWDYTFRCPSGYDCVNKICQNEVRIIFTHTNIEKHTIKKEDLSSVWLFFPLTQTKSQKLENSRDKINGSRFKKPAIY